MEQIIAGKTAAVMFSVPRAERIQILKFNGHNKDQGVAQVSGNLRGTQTPGNRLTEVQGVLVRVIPRVIQMPVNPPEAVQASSDHLAGHPEVQTHEVQEATAEDVDRPYILQVSG
jgi:hypothetical protein